MQYHKRRKLVNRFFRQLLKALRQLQTIPDREAQICQRVRHIRERLGWSQSKFADGLNISKARLASYEYARAPIRYYVGDAVCRIFNINQRWLAEGTSPMTFCVPAFMELRGQDSGGMLFSEVWDFALRATVEKRLSELEEDGIVLDKLDSDDENIYVLSDSGAETEREIRSAVNLLIADISRRVPDSLRRQFLNTVSDAVRRFERKHKLKLQPKAVRKVYLANETKIANTSATKTADQHWGKLREHLRKLTAPHGAKSRLAKAVGLTPQAVSNWFSEARNAEPAFGIAKLAEAWASDEEEKKRKGRGVVR